MSVAVRRDRGDVCTMPSATLGVLFCGTLVISAASRTESIIREVTSHEDSETAGFLSCSAHRRLASWKDAERL
jgi:hypothetical protein